jgi:hypothetical protein
MTMNNDARRGRDTRPRELKATTVATNRRSLANDDWRACGSMSKTQPASALFFQIAVDMRLTPAQGSSTSTASSCYCRDGPNKSRQWGFRCCQQLYDLLSTTVQSSGRNWPAAIRRRSPPAEGGRHVVAPAQSVKALLPHPKLHGPRGRCCRSHAVERVHEDLHRHRQPT